MYVIISGYVYTTHVALCANVKQSPLLGPIWLNISKIKWDGTWNIRGMKWNLIL